MIFSRKKKIILSLVTIGVLATSIITPIIIINNKNKEEEKNKADLEAIFQILKNKSTTQEKIINLPSSTTGKIIKNNKQKIVDQLKKLIEPFKLKGVQIEISMKKDNEISNIEQEIIVKLIKNKFSKEIKGFLVKKKTFATEHIEFIKTILDKKTGEELIIALPSNSTGNIIGNLTNKEAIEKELRKLVDSLNVNGEIDHSSLKGTTISISMNIDAPISTSPQNIIVKISKTTGTTLTTSKTFQVKRFQTIQEINNDIDSIKTILDTKTGEELIIALPSNSTGNIIGNVTNKKAIEKELRKLVDSLNVDGEINHSSLKGTTIMISMSADVPISTSPQNIIVKISKTGGTTLTTSKTFQVKRLLTKNELANNDINFIKTILDKKTGEELIIALPSNSTGNIIGNVTNKKAIEKELRKLVDSLNVNGEINHSSLKGTTISISMKSDNQISTNLQNIIVKISKTSGTTLKTSKTFQVKRLNTKAENKIIVDNFYNLHHNKWNTHSQNKILRISLINKNLFTKKQLITSIKNRWNELKIKINVQFDIKDIEGFKPNSNGFYPLQMTYPNEVKILLYLGKSKDFYSKDMVVWCVSPSKK